MLYALLFWERAEDHLIRPPLSKHLSRCNPDAMCWTRHIVAAWLSSKARFLCPWLAWPCVELQKTRPRQHQHPYPSWRAKLLIWAGCLKQMQGTGMRILMRLLTLFSTLQHLCFILLDQETYPVAMANPVWRADLHQLQLQFPSLLWTRVREGSRNSSARKHSEGESVDDSRSTAALSVTEVSASPVATPREGS